MVDVSTFGRCVEMKSSSDECSFTKDHHIVVETERRVGVCCAVWRLQRFPIDLPTKTREVLASSFKGWHKKMARYNCRRVRQINAPWERCTDSHCSTTELERTGELIHADFSGPIQAKSYVRGRQRTKPCKLTQSLWDWSNSHRAGTFRTLKSTS